MKTSGHLAACVTLNNSNKRTGERMMFRLTFTAALLILLPTMVLGNDLQVSVLRGVVRVVGDADANELRIQRIYSTIHMFTGLNGTTINGSSDPLYLPIQDDLRISMGGGADFVDIRSLYLRNTSHADLTVRPGGGNDEIRIRNANITGDVSILDDLVFRGNNTISVKECRADAIYVETQGSAHIGVTHNECRWIYVESGRIGADFISVVGNDTNYMHVFASDSNDDMVFVGNTISNGYGMIELSGGDDFVQVSINELAFASLTIDGGDGRDTGSGLTKWPWWYSVQILNFE